MILPDPLTTTRLDLRKPEPDDVTSLFTWCFSRPQVMRFLTWKQHSTADETRALLRTLCDRWDRSTQAHWAVTLRGNGQVIGIVSLRLEGRANLSYFLAQEHWGKGYMTEAAGSVCAWALDQPAIDHLWAFCDTENVSSVRVLCKLGFLEDGRLPHFAVFPNISADPRDCLVFIRRRT